MTRLIKNKALDLALKALESCDQVSASEGSYQYFSQAMVDRAITAIKYARSADIGHIGGYWCVDLTCNRCYSADFRFKHTVQPSQPAPDDLDRNACEELNCAEELLDGMSVDLDMEQTDFDCIGDYIKAVFAAQAKHLTTPAAPVQEPVGNEMTLESMSEWPDGFQERLQHVWLDVDGFTPDVKLYDLQRMLAEYGFTMKVYEGANSPAAQRQSNDLADDEVLEIFGEFTNMTGKGWLDLYRMTEDRRKGKKI